MQLLWCPVQNNMHLTVMTRLMVQAACTNHQRQPSAGAMAPSAHLTVMTRLVV